MTLSHFQVLILLIVIPIGLLNFGRFVQAIFIRGEFGLLGAVALVGCVLETLAIFGVLQ